MHVDLRHFVETQQRVVIEVTLFDAPVFDGNFAFECCGEPIDNTAFHLRDDCVRVHHLAAIDGAHHAMHTHLAILHRHLRHLCTVTAERFGNSDAACASGGRRCAPSGFLGGQFEHPEMAWMLDQ